MSQIPRLPDLPEQFVNVVCKQTPRIDTAYCRINNGCTFSTTARFNGAYIRRQRPYIARCLASYRNGPLPPNATCQVLVVEASPPGCSLQSQEGNPCTNATEVGSSFVPRFSNIPSRLVLPPATIIPWQIARTGTPGNERIVSYVDVPLNCPEIPTAVGIIFRTEIENVQRDFGPDYIVFANILEINVRTTVPRPDCLLPTEQFADVRIIDPETGTYSALEGEWPVRWESRGPRNLGFYSTDNEVDIPGGIYSLARQGLAKRVFFGPACNVNYEIIECNVLGGREIPEVHAIKASIVYDGLSDSDERTITLVPFERPPENVQDRFLLEFNNLLNTVIADGYSYIEGRIIHDPLNMVADSNYSRCFRDCLAYNSVTTFIPLSGGQVVSIESGDAFEIIWGDDVVIGFDEAIGEPTITGGQRSIGFAEIPLQYNTNVTKFYLRLYKYAGFYEGPPRTGEQEDPINQICPFDCFKYKANMLDKRTVTLRASANVFFNNETYLLQAGGGPTDGLPPTVIEIVEPLVMDYLGVKRNGEFVEKFEADGVSIHEVVFIVAFNSKPVPNGTAVYITVGGANVEKIAVVRDIVFTELQENNDPPRSIATVTLYPIMATGDFEVQLQAECRYDKRGEIQRSATKCVTISYKDLSEPPPPPGDPPKPPTINDAYQNEMYRYDTINKIWESKKGLRQGRACLSLNWAFDAYDEYLYAIGGMNNNQILTLVERYDIINDKWEQVASMEVPRFHHLSVFDGNFIYVFGGMTVINNSIVMANTVERYDIYSDTWETIGEMPSFGDDSYSIALGKGVLVGSKYYIIGGMRAVGTAGLIDALNDRILIFDLISLTWDYSQKFADENFNIYTRISPFVFLNSQANKLHVVGGAQVDAARAGETQQNLSFPTYSYYVDLQDLNIYIDEDKYQQIPALRYKGESFSVMNEHYLLGGSTATTSVSRRFESITENEDIFNYQKLEDFPRGITAFGATTDEWRYLYVCAGLNSGRPAGFLQILADVTPNRIKLDGKQTAVVKINLIDDVGLPPTRRVRVLVQGVLVFLNEDDLGIVNEQSDQEQQQSADSVLKEALVYPVLFTDNDFYIENGQGSTVLKPRSDDILAKVAEIRKALETGAKAGEGGQNIGLQLTLRPGKLDERVPYKIKIRITVLDSFFYGQTVLDIKDNASDTDTTDSDGEDPTVTDPNGPNEPETGGPFEPPGGPTPPVDPPDTGQPPRIIFEKCAGILANPITIRSEEPEPPVQPDVPQDRDNSVEIQPSLRLERSAVFSLSPPQTPQLASPEVEYYNDELWLPFVKLNAQEATYEEMVKELNILANEIPYGASPIYDAIIKAAEIQTSEIYDNLGKTIYINTDNEESFSRNTLNQAILSIQSIDGYEKVPAVISNFSVVFPLTLSALLSRTDTSKLERIALETRGESVTIIDDQNFDLIFNNLISSLQGGIGYGIFDCIVKTQELSYISSIKLDFELFDNTDASWAYAISKDGYNFDKFSEAFAANETAEIENLTAQKIRFRVNLSSGLSASILEEYDLIPTAGAPALTKIKIYYNEPVIKYLYLNPAVNQLKSSQQVVVAISAELNKYSEIRTGVITNDFINWDDFDSINKPAISKSGKVFIPIRYENTEARYLNETLQRIDGYLYKTFYGPWDQNANVRILDENNEVVTADNYKVLPNQGYVVFNTKQTQKFTISIENQVNLTVGMRLTNYDAKNPLIINSLGYLFNTNTFLPTPTSQRPPEIRNLNISPSPITVYDKIQIIYQYSDFNNDAEKTDKAKIRWYINGQEIEYLRNLRSWNDIQDENDPIYSQAFTFKKADVPNNLTIVEYARSRRESILKVGDKLYFTMQASDSNFLSNLARSQTRIIVGDAPSVRNLRIQSINDSGQTSNIITAQTNIVALFDYYSDSDITNNLDTIIVWYVNNNEFKRGNLNKIVNGISNNRILVGERKNNITALTIGNTITVQILPINGVYSGTTVQSAPIVVDNTPPRVINVTILPTPRAAATATLQLSYVFIDLDVGIDTTTGVDQSSITWFRSQGGNNPFMSIAALQDTRSVPSSYLSSGQKWRATVTPFDGITRGIDVVSNTVTII